MKTFYDLLDIDDTIDVEIALSAIVDNGVPHAKVICNNIILFDTTLQNSVKLRLKLHVLDLVNLSITMSNKVYNSEIETALLIDSICIDGIEVIPKFSHCSTYENDHDQNIVTQYLGFNGTWSLHMDLPFYQWLHQQTAQGWLLEPYEKSSKNHQKRY
tara:strand:+ start:1421 stop:1894 length:474 start_codon:yes stop_codon:yes gene_type:complete